MTPKTPKPGETGIVKLAGDRKLMRLGGMEDVGGKQLHKNCDHDLNIWRSVPGGYSGSRCGDEGRAARTAAASKQAAVAGGPAGAGHPRRTATMAGDNAGSGGMTLGAINRLGSDCGKIAQRQEKHRTTNDGPHKVTKYRGPFHSKFILPRSCIKGKDSLVKPANAKVSK